MSERVWLYCPICNSKTRIQLRTDTILENFPLFCPKCKHENISVQGATNDIKKCFRYAEWKSQIFHSIFTYSLVALIDEIKPSAAFLLSSKLIFSQSSR